MTKRRVFFLAALTAFGSAGAATADITIDLGGGWQATIFDEENVDLETDLVDFGRDLIVIQKLARFFTLDAHDILFEQIAPDNETVSHIVITEEFVFNATGVDWSEFNMFLIGGPAVFDPDASATFSIDPFSDMTFSEGDTRVTFSGGVIEAGGHWNPGSDAGGLVIDVDLSGSDPVSFTFREQPIPAPGALALLVGAGLISRGGRRRA